MINVHFRTRGKDLPEPGQATFKIGDEAAGVRGEIPGGNGEPVLRNELVFANVSDNVVLENKRSVMFAPADVKPKVDEFNGNKRIEKCRPSFVESKLTICL